MDASTLGELFRNAGRLKDLRRSGWVDHGVDQPESVADHSFGVAFMAMVLGDLLGLDTPKLMRMSLLHDLGEVLVGDLTPAMNPPPSGKRAAERAALRQILSGIENGRAYIDLWEEYERGVSPEARLLKNIDKLEMALQAAAYAKRHPEKDLTQFLSSARRAIDLEPVRRILDAVQAPSQEHRGGGGRPGRPGTAF